MLNIYQATKGFIKLVLQISCGATLNIRSSGHSYIIFSLLYTVVMGTPVSFITSAYESSSDIHVSSNLTLGIVLGTCVYLSFTFVPTNPPTYPSTYVLMYLYMYLSVCLSSYIK
jgi:hypothetical protein